MAKIETLTPQQEENIIPHRDFWLNYILSCKNSLDREKAEMGIEWLYSFCKKERPVIIWMDSPFGCQVAANVFEGLLKKEPANIGDNIGDNIGANIWDNIRDNIWANIRANIGANIRDNIGANIWANIGDNIRDNIWDNIWANIRDNKNLKYFPACSYGNVADYGWVAFLDYFIQNNLIKTEKKDDFNCFKELLLSGVYEMIQLDGICYVSDMPVKIVRNASGRLHNPNGYAIKFKDGYGQYYINGRYIPDNVFEKAKTLTKKQFLSERNSDYKGAWYEILGQKKMLDLLGAVEVDTQTIAHRNGDLETVTLLKTKEKFEEIGNEPFAWIKMQCPSTGTQYLQGVEPHHTNALEAIASLSQFKPEEYSFDYRS